jgi:hypothetical protein
MASEDDVRRLALALPGVIADERHGQRHYTIEGKGIAWAYFARDRPKEKRTLRPGIVAIRCPIEEKEMLIEAAPDIYFDDDHYRGFPGVLVRLAAISEAELAARLARAFEIQAPKRRRR